MMLRTMAKRYRGRSELVARGESRRGTRTRSAKSSKAARSRSLQDKIRAPDSTKRPPQGEPEDEEDKGKERIERFDIAFIISLALIALLTLLVIIPYLGPLMVLTLVPYLACNRGCRYVSRRNGVQVGIIVGGIWSIVEIYILFNILTMVKMSLADPAIKTGLDVLILVLIFCANIIFCMIGGYTGGAKFELKESGKGKLQGTHAETT